MIKQHARFYHNHNYTNDAISLLYNIKKVKENCKHFNNVPKHFQKDVLKALPESFFNVNTLKHFDTLIINDLLYDEYFKHIPLYIIANYRHKQQSVTWEPEQYTKIHQLYDCFHVYQIKLLKRNLDLHFSPYTINKVDYQLMSDKNYYTSFNLM